MSSISRWRITDLMNPPGLGCVRARAGVVMILCGSEDDSVSKGESEDGSQYTHW